MKKKYIVTDPCYILASKEWDSCDFGGDYKSEITKILKNDYKCKNAFVENTGYGDWSNMLLGKNVDHENFTADTGMVVVCDFNKSVEFAIKDNRIPHFCYAVFESKDDDISVEFDKTNPCWTKVFISDSNNSWETCDYL